MIWTITLLALSYIAVFILGSLYGRELERGTIREMIRIHDLVNADVTRLIIKIKSHLHIT